MHVRFHHQLIFKISGFKIIGGNAIIVTKTFFLRLNFFKKCQICTIGSIFGVTGGSVILAAVKTPDNKFARIIKPGRNMAAVKTPDKKFA